MKLQFHRGLVIAAGLMTSTQAWSQDSLLDGLQSMVTEGKASINLRYRFEGVDQDGFDEDAKSSLLRSRLTLESGQYKGFSALMEFDDLSSIGAEDYNSTANGKTEFPVVADPVGTDFNQFWVRYNFEGGKGTLGRQRINHGNQRFIGSVAWRQNEQTFDAIRAEFKPFDGLNIDLSYANTVNRIFGPDDGAQPATWDGDFPFARADWTIAEGHKLAAFAYLLDIDPITAYPSGRAEDNSNTTFGVEYLGKLGMFNLAASYATQSDAGDSTLDYDTDYLFLEAAAAFKPVTFKLGYEVLAADNGVGFKTPLATLHKFQGWADKFLVTPPDGIEDLYVSASGKLGPVKVALIYHDFQAEDSSADFGSELNMVGTWPIDKRFLLQLKYASFETDNESRFADTDRIWFTAQLKL